MGENVSTIHTIILTIWGFTDHFPTSGWLHCVTYWLSAGLHKCGRWSEGWVRSSWGNSSPSQLPLLLSPSLPFPVSLSEHSVQSNPGYGPSASPFTFLLVSITGLLRCRCEEWLAWVELGSGWLTESWHPFVGTTVSAFRHPQHLIFWPQCHKNTKAVVIDFFFQAWLGCNFRKHN